ncbi:GNAT family N-acetyltransferase [Paenisporosarcina indica]|uniref:GNAT family N-acetyltransferase n=1 Tax=Paenisporosarcina indica TaxID=650093 RepID=UPI00094F7820|nr:GNAT family N-acetyltransferase [Paenisporosarcina indica]
MVTLKLMSSEEFQQYLDISVVNYAKEKVASGNWSQEESLTKAKEEYARLLPDGEKSENNYLYNVLHENHAVGIIWLAQKTNGEGFIYDISISETYRGCGYGKEAMKEIEGIAKELGMTKIGLHVFGHNLVARGLYESLGYETTNVVMVKEI